MTRLRIKLSLFLTYIVFAMLLNSVGTVILQVINSYGVSKPHASILEGCKDISIAVISFVVACFLPRIGFRNAMMMGLALVTLACVAMPLFPSFLTTEILFLCIGIAFALVKVSVYSTVGLITDNAKEHASFMNTIEGVFMIGVLMSYWLFSFFIDSGHPQSTSWLHVYWPLAGLCAANIVVLLTTPVNESQAQVKGARLRDDFVSMLCLMKRPLVYIFVLSAFLYVLIEQGIGSWLPTFNNQILHLPTAMSVQATSIFAACLAIGRLSAGGLMRRFSWYPVLCICILAMAGLVLVALPLANGVTVTENISWLRAPMAAYIFPLIGLFMAPIYPAINSVMLSALPKPQHSAMTGLIVIFSALGGTSGSLITGLIFAKFDGQTAFYLSLVPTACLLLTLFFFKRQIDRHPVAA